MRHWKFTLFAIIGLLGFMATVVHAQDPNKVWLGTAYGGDVTISSPEWGSVILRLDSAGGDTTAGWFRTNPVFLDDYNSFLTTIHFIRVDSGASTGHCDSIFTRLITGCLKNRTTLCAETLSTDTITTPDTVVQKWLGRGTAGFKVADSTLNRWLWWDVSIQDSISSGAAVKLGVQHTYWFEFWVDKKK